MQFTCRRLDTVLPVSWPHGLPGAVAAAVAAVAIGRLIWYDW